MICNKIRDVDQSGNVLGARVWFFCPGCEEAHAVRVMSTGGGSVWEWNGSEEAPTFSPSLLCTGVGRCHSFIKDGKIQFLNDCSHALAGKTVPLPELPDWLKR